MRIILVNYNPVIDTGVVISIFNNDWIVESIINYDSDKKVNVCMNSECEIAAVSFLKKDNGEYKETGMSLIEGEIK